MVGGSEKKARLGRKERFSLRRTIKRDYGMRWNDNFWDKNIKTFGSVNKVPCPIYSDKVLP